LNRQRTRATTLRSPMRVVAGEGSLELLGHNLGGSQERRQVKP